MSEERKKNKLDPAKVLAGELMAFTYYGKVNEVKNGGSGVVVFDVDNQREMLITGTDLIAGAASADQYAEEVKVTKTEAAQLLVDSANRPFTVVFEKQDSTDRTLRGRLVHPEPLLGRSKVEDLDVTGVNRMRLVDHRTIKSLVVDGVKYIVK